MTTCECGRPVNDGYVCTGCADTARDALHRVVEGLSQGTCVRSVMTLNASLTPHSKSSTPPNDPTHKVSPTHVGMDREWSRRTLPEDADSRDGFPRIRAPGGTFRM